MAGDGLRDGPSLPVRVLQGDLNFLLWVPPSDPHRLRVFYVLATVNRRETVGEAVQA